MLRDAVEHRSHVDDDRRTRQLRPERAHIVGRGQRRHVERRADLAAIDVEGADHLDVTRKISAEDVMHQADRLVVAGSVELDSLQQAARAVPHPHDANGNLSHYPPLARGERSARRGASPIYSTGNTQATGVGGVPIAAIALLLAESRRKIAL